MIYTSELIPLGTFKRLTQPVYAATWSCKWHNKVLIKATGKKKTFSHKRHNRKIGTMKKKK